MSRTRRTPFAGANQAPRDHIIRSLRCRLCVIDQQQEASEGSRQHHTRRAVEHLQRAVEQFRRAVEHIRRADAALLEFDGLWENLDWVRAMLRRELAEADQ
jgi:hypothetical protein